MAADVIDQTAPDAGAAAAPEGAAAQPPAPVGFTLDAIPEDARGEWYTGLESHLGELQQAGDRWKPYEELGIHDIEPEQLSNLFEWLGALEDPQAAEAAIRQLAESVGVSLEAPQPPAPAAAAPADGQDEVRQQLAALQERLDQREQAEQHAQVEQETRQRITAEWEQVRAAHKEATGQDLAGDMLEQVKALAKQYAYDNDTPIQSAYDFIMKLSAGAQQEFVKGAPVQPSAAEPAGRANTAAVATDDFDEAERLMKLRRQTPTA